MLIFVGGGSRSGKSRFALERARAREGPRAFLATAELLDAEMAERAKAHAEERGGDFLTVEEPVSVADWLVREGGRFQVVVIDCLTLWISNLILARRSDVEPEVSRLFQAARESPAQVYLISNEVGCGIVPENALARQFRDLAGTLNQRAVEWADEAWVLMFGVPIRLK